MTELNKEHFEAWLMSKPPESEFYFLACSDCLVAQYLHESTPHIDATVGDKYYRTKCMASEEKFPDWLWSFLDTPIFIRLSPITFKEAQSRWTSLHPIDSQTIPITFPSPVAAVDVEVGL